MLPVKVLECVTKVALDEACQWVVVLTKQGFQPYVVVLTLEGVDLVVVMALEAVVLAVEAVPQKHPASAALSDVSVPSVDTTVVEASAVEVQDLNLCWFSLQQPSCPFSAVVLFAFL